MGGTQIQPQNTPYFTMVADDGTDKRTVLCDAYGRLFVNNINFSPIGNYVAHDIDTANDAKYYGFLEGTGSWYIMKEVTSAGSYRFCVGTADYSTAWTARAGQTYTYIDLLL